MAGQHLQCTSCLTDWVGLWLAVGLVVQCAALWDRVRGEERWSQAWGMRALAAVQRISVSLAAFADRLYMLTQPHAERCPPLSSHKAPFIQIWSVENVHFYTALFSDPLATCVDVITSCLASNLTWAV